MDIFLQILVIVLLMLVFIQDLKFRAIHILLPVLLLVTGIVSFVRLGYEPMIVVYSVLFLIITFAGLYIYLSVKNKNFTNPFKKNMGLGDLLFFVAVIPLFSTYNYILFFITGMLFSIIGFLVIKLFTKTDLVPLAGLLALYVVLLKGVSYITEFNVFFNNML